jgi:flagellar hook-associated protein 2
MLSLVSGTPGASGNISVSGNTIVATSSTALSYTGTAGSGSTASTGSLAALAGTTDTVSGSLSIKVGSGTAQTIVVGSAPSSGAAANTIYTGSASGYNTLTGLENAIVSNSTNLGFTASIVTSSSGAQSLSITSNTAGSAGSLSVTSNILDNTTLGYNTAVTGKDAKLTVDGVAMTSASNTVANLIPGVTFQLLAPSTEESDNSLEQVQVVIANNNAGVESTVTQMVSDYNSLISAVNTQEGNDSSGNPEPLFGSPTLSLLQQQLLSGLNLQNPNGNLTSISSTTNTTLAGSMSIQVGSGTTENFVIGAPASGGLSNTYYTGTGSGSNTLGGLAATINAASMPTTLNYTDTPFSGSSLDIGQLTGIANSAAEISGSISVQVGTGTAENIVVGVEPATGAAANTIYTGSGVSTMSGLAGFINTNQSSLGFTASVLINGDGTSSLSFESQTAGSSGTLTVNPNLVASGIGLTASVVTTDGQSTLSLASQTEGSAGGALTVTSKIAATSNTPVGFNTTVATDSANASGSSTEVAGVNDALSGSISIQVGDGMTFTVSVPSSPNNNLSGLAEMIMQAPMGVTASVVENQDGTYSLSLASQTAGEAGDLTVTSNILDTTATNTSTLNYTNSSDINSLTTLGISVNNDGSLTFDAASLDSVLNLDYSGVVGFFQNANSWGQSFSAMVTNAGTSSPTGVLSLGLSSNSNIESTLNADISKESALISAQQSSLTTELNNANQIMEELPTQLEGVNELYSAITGYNQNSNG